jgi:hypothetical protein
MEGLARTPAVLDLITVTFQFVTLQGCGFPPEEGQSTQAAQPSLAIVGEPDWVDLDSLTQTFLE